MASLAMDMMLHG
ncbi:hypothetical protein QN277_007514 [Acacia crassicarpa]|uniref:Uncharacterized protein n=1 Tax=Acacia crassicarpa TaxID=499986 RepID=A0AAE1IUX9_9FABA|nr:hypothetical protein QN277_007514 [Acacia crassicarpa]